MTMQRIPVKPVRHRRSLGVYLLAAVLIILSLATTVFAYIGFTRYENPIQMLKAFYGNEKLESSKGGEVFRSGCCYQRGLGKVFYFQPGHEENPTYHIPEVQKIINNAVHWAAPNEVVPEIICPWVESVEENYNGDNK